MDEGASLWRLWFVLSKFQWWRESILGITSPASDGNTFISWHRECSEHNDTQHEIVSVEPTHYRRVSIEQDHRIVVDNAVGPPCGVTSRLGSPLTAKDVNIPKTFRDFRFDWLFRAMSPRAFLIIRKATPMCQHRAACLGQTRTKRKRALSETIRPRSSSGYHSSSTTRHEK